ncbi:SusD family protein [Tenacibaculum sp. MAR_2009_124]|uniref:RagB/SusD family nutrient uptake outer membrane protein n=1 Tax=Tenacibaculum sp. MAR_2009_124 TaxID=1250059 RepID=UPI0008963E63|nr:RagB/SusD family nutrient uptake outer membrane protein [Tenacibaculum sp. MAR_2009_124]SEB77346.1 SusD family protein [Tenacibaculum sp. MAR_2009_124]
MIKKYIKPIIFGAVTLMAIGCSESFLEETPTETISVDDVGQTGEIYPEIVEAVLRGLYETTFQTQTGGLNTHEDFGQKGYDVITDILSGDMALSRNTYNRYSSIAQLIATNDFTFAKPNYMAWRYYYRIINQSNLVIKSLGGDDLNITETNRAALGQAKAMRAYGYFYLTQLYVTEYTEATRVLPIYLEGNSDAQPQATTKEVYDLIIKDLDEAIILLDGFNRDFHYQVNQNVAKTLLAYTYASKGTSVDNIKARELAEEIIQSGQFPITTKTQSTGGFNSVYNNPSWMWGVDITSDNSLGLVSWWGQMDYFTFSYQSFGDHKTIDESLYGAIDNNDVRKTQFHYEPGNTKHLMPLNKFYHEDRNFRGQRIIESDYVYMRIDEMYLLSAELAAKEGNEAEAKNRLKDVLSQRFDNATDYAYVDGLAGEALLDEIYLQTRIEFWGEGKSYLALKRNKETVVRGANHLYLVGEAINHDDERLTLEIPQSEVQNNPFMN